MKRDYILKLNPDIQAFKKSSSLFLFSSFHTLAKATVKLELVI